MTIESELNEQLEYKERETLLRDTLLDFIRDFQEHSPLVVRHWCYPALQNITWENAWNLHNFINKKRRFSIEKIDVLLHKCWSDYAKVFKTQKELKNYIITNNLKSIPRVKNRVSLYDYTTGKYKETVTVTF